MPPKFMSVSEASQQLLSIIQKYNSEKKPSSNCYYINIIITLLTICVKHFPVLNEASLCVGIARVGSENQQIVACTLKEMSQFDLGPPLHSLVIVGPVLHPLESEYLNQFKI